MALPCGYPKFPQRLCLQPIDDEPGIEAYSRPPTESEGCVVGLLPDREERENRLNQKTRRRCA
jgi:hypothetical protein